MGLREINAARTRDLILDTAFDLFSEQGFDGTTLDEIAERSGVSLSTLYRYFKTKDMLVLEPVALRGQMAKELAARPDNEPLDVALGQAVYAILRTPRSTGTHLLAIRRLLRDSPTLRSRVRDELDQERLRLQSALAVRLGRPQDDPYCAMTARIALGVFELAGSTARESSSETFSEDDFVKAATEVMQSLLRDPPTLPRPRETE